MTARFGPDGLMTDRVLTPEGSAAFLTHAMRRAAVSASVPAGVRDPFDRVRELFRYAAFRYGFFAVADQVAWTIPETALGVRFIEMHGGRVGYEPTPQGNNFYFILPLPPVDYPLALCPPGE